MVDSLVAESVTPVEERRSGSSRSPWAPASRADSLRPPMLDHVFTDAITALREAFENALLERQAFEEHFQVDVLLGDLTWETSYGLPGEGLPPRVVAHITFDWPTWSQTAYRRWYVDEVLEEPPAIEMEIVFRIQLLTTQPEPATFLKVLPDFSPAIGNESMIAESAVAAPVEQELNGAAMPEAGAALPGFRADQPGGRAREKLRLRQQAVDLAADDKTRRVAAAEDRELQARRSRVEHEQRVGHPVTRI